MRGADKDGNLSWQAAFEMEPATYTIALRTFKDETHLTPRVCDLSPAVAELCWFVKGLMCVMALVRACILPALCTLSCLYLVNGTVFTPCGLAPACKHAHGTAFCGVLGLLS